MRWGLAISGCFCCENGLGGKSLQRLRRSLLMHKCLAVLGGAHAIAEYVIEKVIAWLIGKVAGKPIDNAVQSSILAVVVICQWKQSTKIGEPQPSFLEASKCT